MRALVEAGADVRYTRDVGYDAQLDVLAVPVEPGAGLAGVSAWQQFGLRVPSLHGRFDGVRLRLEAGADRGQLDWTPLIEAVALGSPSTAGLVASRFGAAPAVPRPLLFSVV